MENNKRPLIFVTLCRRTLLFWIYCSHALCHHITIKTLPRADNQSIQLLTLLGNLWLFVCTHIPTPIHEITGLERKKRIVDVAMENKRVRQLTASYVLSFYFRHFIFYDPFVVAFFSVAFGVVAFFFFCSHFGTSEN